MNLITAIVVMVTVAYSVSIEPHWETSPFVIIWNERGQSEIIDTNQPFPRTKATSSDVTLYHYTTRNPYTPTRLPLDVSSLTNSSFFRKTKKTYFLIHDWHNDKESLFNTVVKYALLSKLEVNVFVVDWSKLAEESYLNSYISVPRVGALLGDFIGEMQRTYKLDASQFTLIGYGLGSHVAGYAGATVKGNIGIIVALNPAGPLFPINDTDIRLNPADAKFVHAIHTETTYLGYSESLGHADIWPNGGNDQPGCPVKTFGSCNQKRSILFFAESILTGGFTAWSCDSYKDFSDGKCWKNPTTTLGGLNIDTSASGDYYLKTNSQPPYSQG